MKEFIPRDYQKEALSAILSHKQDGLTRQLISLPTGCGKTVIFGMLTKAVLQRTLIFAHREELLKQAEEKIHMVYPNASTGIFQADERGGLDAEICIASVQTAIRHVHELRERNFKLMVCDEAHHAVSESYTYLFKELGFMEDNPEKLLVGVTATAFRGDKLKLKNVFEDIVFHRSILAMIKAGYLVPPRGLLVQTGTDISEVKLSKGDFNVGALAKKIDTPNRNRIITDTYLERGENRHGVVFTVRVEHALTLAEAFRHKGISCEAIHGKMPKYKRREILKKYANHDIQILTNCGVLTEGWDVPDTDIIMMARPTKSELLYVQCMGRGLRLAENKKDCLVVDFVDVSKIYELYNMKKVLEEFHKEEKEKEKPEAEEPEFAKEGHEVREEKAPINGSWIVPKFFEQDITYGQKFTWVPILNGYKVNMTDGSMLWVKEEDKITKKYSPNYITKYGDCIKLSTETRLNLGYAVGVCEDYARIKNLHSFSENDAKWASQPATVKQRELLMKRNIKFDPNITKGEVNKLLQQDPTWNEPITLKQLYFIKSNKLHSEPELLTKMEATKIIKEYKAKNA